MVFNENEKEERALMEDIQMRNEGKIHFIVSKYEQFVTMDGHVDEEKEMLLYLDVPSNVGIDAKEVNTPKLR